MSAATRLHNAKTPYLHNCTCLLYGLLYGLLGHSCPSSHSPRCIKNKHLNMESRQCYYIDESFRASQYTQNKVRITNTRQQVQHSLDPWSTPADHFSLVSCRLPSAHCQGLILPSAPPPVFPISSSPPQTFISCCSCCLKALLHTSWPLYCNLLRMPIRSLSTLHHKQTYSQMSFKKSFLMYYKW